VASITVYGAPWCPDCRRAKQFLSEQRISYDWVDIDADPLGGAEFVREKNAGKQIIPTIVFEDGSFLVEPENAELAQKLGITMQAGRSHFDLIVIGGGPTGLTASMYAAREGIDALVIERSALGGNAGVTERVDNFPGFPDGISGAELAERFTEQARRYGVEMLSAVGVEGIRTDEDGCVEVTTGTGDVYTSRAAIVATGSSYRRLGVEGEDDLIGAGIHYCATCDGPFYKGASEVMVIGGGNSAIEEGLFLTRFSQKVVVVARGELTASALLREKVQDDPRFEIITDAEVDGFEKGDDGRLGSVTIHHSGETSVRHPAGVFVFIGLTPNTDFLSGRLDLDERGFVVTDPTFATSMPGVFAAGDCRAGSTKQMGSAAGEGITALLMARNHLERMGEVAAHVAS
jgi:thioredoxin reductase (NADPH)